jgi:hypothetical protein
LPAVALAAAQHLPALLRQRGVRLLAAGFSVASALLLASTLLYFGVFDPAAGARIEMDYGLVPWRPLGGLLLAFAIVFAATRVRRAVWGTALMIAAYWLIGGWWLFPVISPAVSGAHFMSEVESSLDGGQVLGIVRFKEKFLVHAQRPLTHFGYRRADFGQEFADAAAWLAQSPRRRLLVGEDGWQDCFDAGHAGFIAHTSGRDWYLVSPDGARSRCIAAGNAARAIEYPAGRLCASRGGLEHGETDFGASGRPTPRRSCLRLR